MFLQDSLKRSGRQFDKVRTPQETLDWVESRFRDSGISILKECVRIDKGRLGIPVYVSRYSPEASSITGTQKQMGKGVTPEQARCSAVMELVERFSVFSFLNEQIFPVLPYGIQDDPKVSLEHLLQAVQCREDLSSDMQRLLNDFALPWADGIHVNRVVFSGNAVSEETATVNIPFQWFWIINEYNGSASGNSLEEAGVQAISEVVERHCCSEITRHKLRTPTIDTSSVTDPVLRELLDRFQSLGINLVLKDFSLDTGIPTVGAIAWDPSTFPERSEIVYTAGTSTSPVRAAVRAITEVAQLAGDFDTTGRYLESGLPKFATLDEAAYVLSSDEKVDLHNMPDCSHDNFRLEIIDMATRLYKTGFPIYLVDITHPRLGIPAVYAIMPGNHFRDRTINMDLSLHLAKLATSGYLQSHEAMVLLERLYAIYPEKYHLAFYLGHLWEQQEEWREASKWMEQALSLGPDADALADILCHIGFCLKEMGDIDGAVDYLKRAISEFPEQRDAWSLLGYCRYVQERYYEAIECFERVIEIDPGSALDYANIGSNLRKLGMGQAAQKWYRMALELDPGLEWAREHLSSLEQALNSG